MMIQGLGNVFKPNASACTHVGDSSSGLNGPCSVDLSTGCMTKYACSMTFWVDGGSKSFWLPIGETLFLSK